jgi:hypothetical protein
MKIKDMKAYQVYSGDTDKYDRQTYELVATYLDRNAALAHARRIAEETPLNRDELVESEWDADKTCKIWYARGWEYVGIAKFKEITII